MIDKLFDEKFGTSKLTIAEAKDLSKDYYGMIKNKIYHNKFFDAWTSKVSGWVSISRQALEKKEGAKILFSSEFLDDDKEKILKFRSFVDRFLSSTSESWAEIEGGGISPEKVKKRISKGMEDFNDNTSAFSRNIWKRVFGDKSVKIYRGVDGDYLDVLGIKDPQSLVGKDLITNNLESWTTNKGTARRFASNSESLRGGVIIEIEITGDSTFASYLSDSTLREWEENEVILKQGTHRITKITKMPGSKMGLGIETKAVLPSEETLKLYRHQLELEQEVNPDAAIMLDVTPQMADWLKSMRRGKPKP